MLGWISAASYWVVILIISPIFFLFFFERFCSGFLYRISYIYIIDTFGLLGPEFFFFFFSFLSFVLSYIFPSFFILKQHGRLRRKKGGGDLETLGAGYWTNLKKNATKHRGIVSSTSHRIGGVRSGEKPRKKTVVGSE